MRRSDIPFAVEISDSEKWGIPASDFQRILRLDPRGSFIAIKDSGKVGVATSVSFRKEVAWIGNVVVDRRFRGRHLGLLLVIYALTYLKKRHVKNIALYCFDENIGFYRKLGFAKGKPFVRMRWKPKTQPESPPGAISRQSLTQSLSLDRKAFGADRSRLIRDWLNSKGASMIGISRGRASSYMLVRDYDDMREIGPWVAVRATEKQLSSLLRTALAASHRRPVEVSISLHNFRALNLFKRHGFRAINTGTSMYFDRVPKMGSPAAVLALGFLDKG